MQEPVCLSRVFPPFIRLIGAWGGRFPWEMEFPVLVKKPWWEFDMVVSVRCCVDQWLFLFYLGVCGLAWHLLIGLFFLARLGHLSWLERLLTRLCRLTWVFVDRL